MLIEHKVVVACPACCQNRKEDYRPDTYEAEHCETCRAKLFSPDDETPEDWETSVEKPDELTWEQVRKQARKP